MFDTKSSFILSKLGIQRFQSQTNEQNSEVFFGALCGDILALLDKSFNELEDIESRLFTKIIKSIIEDANDHSLPIEINNESEIKEKPKLMILFTNTKTNLAKDFTPLIESKPLHILNKSLEDKKKLWLNIKKYKDGSATS